MGKKSLLLAVVLLLGIPGMGRGETPHQAADRCFDRFTAECDRHCGMCHTTIGIAPPPMPAITDFYPDFGSDLVPPGPAPPFGDIPLCLECHPEKVHPGFNHPVGIPFGFDFLERDFHPSVPGLQRGDSLERELLSPPPGPKLYCDETRHECRIFCTTCHNPHRGRVGMLRTPYSVTMLCLSCHRK